MRAGPHCPIDLCRIDGLRLDDCVEFVLWKRLLADNHFLHRESDKRKLRHEQHAELGGSGSGEYCHRAGHIYLYLGEWFNEHEPNGDHHLHADGKQCIWLKHIHGESYRGSGRRSSGDNDNLVPRGNTRRQLCRLHNRRNRRLSAIHLFRKHECQLSSIAGGDVARYGDGDRQQLADRRPRHLHARICSHRFGGCAGDPGHQHRNQR